MQIILKILLTLAIATNCFAFEAGQYVSVRGKDTNVRTGPSKNHRVSWRILRPNEPLKFIREYNGWLFIQDSSGERGWIYSSLISKTRYVIVTKKTNLYKPNKKDIAAHLMPNLLCKLNSSSGGYAKVICKNDFKGLVEIKNLWGVGN